jgi:hypothetical protein
LARAKKHSRAERAFSCFVWEGARETKDEARREKIDRAKAKPNEMPKEISSDGSPNDDLDLKL